MSEKKAENGFRSPATGNELAKQTEAKMDSEPDLRFGCCGWKPSFLQCLNRGGWYVAFMFIGNVFLSMTVNGLVGVVLSSLETRFELSSNQSSWIASAYELAAIPVMLFVSLFGHRSHRPRVTAIGLFLMVIGCLLFVVPHFTTGIYRPGSQIMDHGICLTEENSFNGTIDRSVCKEGEREESGQLSTYLWVFIFARVLQGLGTVPLQTLGVTFLDDVVTKQRFSLYVAIYFAGGVLGPAIGYIAGGFLLDVYTDFPSVDAGSLGISTGDPRWVGAWWVGFLVGGITLFFITIPFFGYANDLPGAAKIREEKETEAHGDEGAVNEDLSSISWGELWTMVKTVLSNPAFVFLTLFCVTDALIITGFTNFGPKYVERQFSVSSSFAGMLFGLISIPGGVGGTICGGWVIQRFKLKVAQIMKLELVLTFVLIGAGCCFFIVCDPADFAGVNVPYTNTSSSSLSLLSSCNSNCSCDFTEYTPICGVDNVQYFSPCHAGCLGLDKFPGTEFSNCSCISSGMSSVPMATRKSCTRADCNLMPLFLVLFFIGMFIIFFNSGMNCTVTLRIVPSDTRALALGLQGLATRLLGTFPGPLAFGAAFDGACILWQKTCNGGTGSCLSYNNTSMSLYLFLVSIGIKVVSVIFMVLAWKLYKAPKAPIVEEKEICSRTGPIGQEKPVVSIGTVSNGVVSNGGVSNGGVSNGGVSNGGVSNGAVSNGAVSNGAVSNGTVSNGLTHKVGIDSPVFESPESYQNMTGASPTTITQL